jgi:hypothetical protein
MTNFDNQPASDDPLFAYFLITLPANRCTQISKYDAYSVAVPGFSVKKVEVPRWP